MTSRSLRASFGRLAASLRAFGERRSSETASLIFSAIAIGLLVGLAAVGFDWLVRSADELVTALRGRLGLVPGALVVLLTPALGGLLVAPITVRLAPDARGSGIPGVMLAVSNLGGRVPRRLLLWRPLASAISISSGASLGTEGPVVQLGASLASLMAGLLRLGDERRRNLVAVAAAGGIAATFNAPIAGVLFALEVILGRFQARYFASVVIGAVAATAVSRTALGDTPAFAVLEARLQSPAELLLYLVLGVMCALVSVGFIRLIVLGEDGFNRVRVSPWLRPALGGLLVGALALVVPQVLGRGYDTTGRILQGELTSGGFLLGLATAKMLATSLSLGSWGSGGVFAPVLMVGAAFGGAFGGLARGLFPELVVTPSAYALVGMGAVFSGVTRSPMSSIVMIFEMADSYEMILPLLLSAVIATLIADLFQRESIYQVMLSRKGLSLMRLREIDLLQTVTVGEVMDREVPALGPDETLSDLAERMVESHHHGFVLLEHPDAVPDAAAGAPRDPAIGAMVGIVTLSDLERARRAGVPPSTPLRQLCTPTVHSARVDEPASDVLERMARLGIGRMPVVDPSRPKRPIGFVRQRDLARAYYLAVQRERQEEEASETLRLRDLTGQEIVEVRVPAGSRLAGVPLRAAGLPHESIVVAIRRDGRTLFPHGETTLLPGDTVVANVAPGHSASFRALLTESAKP